MKCTHFNKVNMCNSFISQNDIMNIISFKNSNFKYNTLRAVVLKLYCSHYNFYIPFCFFYILMKYCTCQNEIYSQ